MFYQMLFFKNKPVDTRGLTTAFKWNTHDVFVQQDVQEFSCILMESLEKKAKEANRLNFIEELFKGKLESYIRCTKVDFKSSRVEEFQDI